MHRIAFHCSCKPCFPFEKLRSKYIEFGKEKRHIWIENQEANANGKKNNKGKYVHVLNDITNNGLCVQLLTWVSENVCVCFDILRCQHFSSACKSSDKTGIPNVHDTHTQAHSLTQYSIETIAIRLCYQFHSNFRYKVTRYLKSNSIWVTKRWRMCSTTLNHLYIVLYWATSKIIITIKVNESLDIRMDWESIGWIIS